MDASQPSLNIVVIDDRPADRALVRRSLDQERDARYIVREEETGEAGLAAMKAMPPDCAILASTLPDADGIEVLRRVRADERLATTAVVMLARSGDAAVAGRAIQVGVQGYMLAADLTPGGLALAVRDAIEKMRLPRALEQRGRELTIAAQAAEQTRTAAEAAQQRLAFLAEAGSALASTLESETILERVARLAVPILGDWCAVDAIGQEGDARRVAVVHVDPTKAALARELVGGPPVDLADYPLAGVTRADRAVSWPEPTAAQLSLAASSPALRRLTRQLGIGPALIVPLRARDRAFGAITLVASAPGRRHGPDDRALAEELARWAGLALDNARLYRESQEAIRRRDEFLSIAAHELKTPVAGLKLRAQLALRDGERGRLDAARTTRTLAVIDDAASRLAGLTNDLLDVSRIRMGQLALRLTTLDLAALAEGVIARYAERPEGRRVEIDWRLVGGLVHGDRDRLEQVLVNLLDNAIKYSPGGGTVRVRLRPDEGGLLLSVQDEGIGLPPGAAEAIFQPFGRAPNAARHQLPGMGLGLFICRSIVERHDGRIWAESEGEGRGTRLAVWLPAAEVGAVLTHNEVADDQSAHFGRR